ncbi:MAG: hypothetical protein HUU20_18180 [Pirellulales bacterium]|nr:hypothetical protein [Pirellulales bacterium]
MSIVTSSKRRLFRFTRPQQSPESAPRPRRWIWTLVAVVLLVLWLLPMLAAKSPVVGWVLNSASADLNGTLHLRSISLGWLSPVRVSDVELRDPDGQIVLAIPKAEGNRSLLGILFSPSSLGRFRIEQPNLTLVLRPDGSNLEDLLAKIRANRSAEIDLGIDVVDAKVTVLDTAAQRSWEIDKLELALTLPADQQKPWEAGASGNIADAQAAGNFRFAAKMRQGGYRPANDPPPSNDLTLNTERVPLELFQSPIRRLAAKDILLAGRLGSAVTCSWDPDAVKNSLSVQGKAAVEQFRLAAPPLGSDQVQLASLEAEGQVALQGGNLRIDRLTATTDAGNASLRGTFDLSRTSIAELLAGLPRQNYQLESRIDLARLAAILPGTLRLQEDTRITSGQVQLKLTSRPGPEGMLWQGNLESSSLQAINRGRALVWENPIQVTLAARETPQGPVIENLDCRSSFLKLHGSGTRAKLNATASFDLGRLAQELGNFVDLGSMKLGGNGWAKLNWSQSPEKNFTADAQLQFRQFECTLPGRPAWKEENLTVTLASTGRTDFANTRLDTASLLLESGGDRLDARLLEAVPDLRTGNRWPVEVRAQGQLEPWRPRLALWANTDGWNLAGSHQLFAQVSGSAEAVQVRRLQWSVEQLMVLAPGIQVREPHAELVLSGAWSRPQGRVDLQLATLTAPSLSAQVNNAVVTLADRQSPELAGTLQFQADIDRVQQWFTVAPQHSAWRVAGQLSGKADLRQASATTAAEIAVAVRNLLLTHESGRRVPRSSVQLVARGTFDNRNQTVQLERVELTTEGLGTTGAGTASLAEALPRIDADGQVNYDAAMLNDLLQSYAGPAVRLTGSGASRVAWHGPLDPAVAEASAGFTWKTADVYGFRVGPGSLESSLAGGLLSFKPLDCDVSEGKMQMLPRVQFAPGPAELSVEPGRVADKIRINPTMCANGLQYIAPALAGVASAEGRFSIELDRCRIPLADPKQGQLQGRMMIHTVQIGPGPLVQELAVALGYTGPAQLRRESTVDFQMADRRVYHRGAEIAFPDLSVRTYGSVGLDDKSLALVAEMPIPPKWRGNNVLGTALKDQVIQLPIAGTLDRPKLDRTALEQASRQFLQNAAQNILQDQLNRQLNRLLGPPQPVR